MRKNSCALPGWFTKTLCLSLIGWLSACVPANPLVDNSWKITNVTVIDAVQGLRPNQTVVMQGDEIVAVRPSIAKERRSENDLDGTGKYLIPGLWDMHVHLTYDSLLTPTMPRLFLSYGITSVRDTGGLLEKLHPVIAAMRAPDALAPRVFYSGPLLDGESVVYDGNARPEIGVRTATTAEAWATVALLKAAGVDFIKIYELVSPEVFAALVAAAREHKLPIAAHVPLAMRARAAGPQVGSMEHLRNIEMDCATQPERWLKAREAVLKAPHASGYELRSELHRMQRLPAIAAYDETECEVVFTALSSTIQVPTLRLNAFAEAPPFGKPDWPEALERLPPPVAASWQTATEAWRSNPEQSDTTYAAWSRWLVGQMHKRGVPIGAGTDTPIAYALPGYSLHNELEQLVRAGLTPLEALRSATLRPAEFFGLEQEMGTIEVGKRADLVLLSANPLDNITNTRQIESVVSKGRLLNRNQLDQMHR